MSLNIIQLETAFPIEIMDLPIPFEFNTIRDKEIKKYYQKEPDKNQIEDDTKIKENVHNINKYTNIQTERITEDEIKLLQYIKENSNSFPLNPTYRSNISNRFLFFNCIYDKLFKTSLNVFIHNLKKNKKNTIVVLPSYEENTMLNLKSDVNKFYQKYYDLLKNQDIEFKDNIFFYKFPVIYRDNYADSIKNIFSKLYSDIRKYNETIYRLSYDTKKTVEDIVFITDAKKGLFTGMLNKQLSKEQNDILNKEFNSFLAYGRTTKIASDINISYSSIKSECNQFQSKTGISIQFTVLTKDKFNRFLSILNENYKKAIDTEYKKSLELQDNIKKLYIYYKIINSDKVLDDEIKVGSNKLYTLQMNKDNKKYNGYFTLISAPRQIYRFREDRNEFYKRVKSDKEPNIIDQNNETYENGETHSDLAKKDNETQQDFSVKIKHKYGFVLFEKMDDTKDTGKVFEYIDKIKDKYRWFSLKDIDKTFLDKQEIRYYNNILFDKDTLISYLKSKNKYSDKTNISYEFLKINSTAELIEYCDYIETGGFKKNIYEKAFFKFTPKQIIQNIIDIVFQANTPIYIKSSSISTEKQRETTSDSYKIVKVKVFDTETAHPEFVKDENLCGKTIKDADTKEKTKCDIEFELYENENKNSKDPKDDKNQRRVLHVTVTKSVIKDVGLLQFKTDCKTQKNKIRYTYKKILQNVTERFFPFLLKGGKSGNRKLKKKNKNKTLKR
jgi:hypothetical protein